MDENPQAPQPAANPMVVGEIPYTLCNVPLHVLVLADGRRVLHAQDVDALLKMLVEAPADDASIAAELHAFGEFIEHLPTPTEGA